MICKDCRRQVRKDCMRAANQAAWEAMRRAHKPGCLWVMTVFQKLKSQSKRPFRYRPPAIKIESGLKPQAVQRSAIRIESGLRPESQQQRKESKSEGRVTGRLRRNKTKHHRRFAALLNDPDSITAKKLYDKAIRQNILEQRNKNRSLTAYLFAGRDYISGEDDNKDDAMFHALRGGAFETNRKRH
jgi:hypothetical protein